MPEDLCGKWKPRKKAYCARVAGHAGDCLSEEDLAKAARNRAISRRARGREPRPADRRTAERFRYKLKRYGLTQADFDALLIRQGNRCGMCGTSFDEAVVYIDHDHTCCPVPPNGLTRSCGKCVRGLLCYRCNTALGYVERYLAMAEAYVELLGRYSNRTNWVKTIHHALDSRRTVTETPTLRGTVRRLHPSQVTKLVNEYRAGATVYELAERFTIHRVTVSEHLHRQGVKMRRQGLTDQRITEAARLYERGWSLARIARRYAVDPCTVWRALRAHGVQMRDTHGMER